MVRLPAGAVRDCVAACGVRALAWCAALLATFPTAALAHDVRITAHVHDGMIHGEVSFAGQTPASSATVTALDPSGEEIGEATTDEQGEFSLEAQFRCDHRLLVDTGEGHGAECTIAAARLPASLPPRGDHPHAHTSASEQDRFEILYNEIRDLRDQFDKYQQKTRLRDVLGGVGYIFGIAGIAFYLLGVKRRHPEKTA